MANTYTIRFNFIKPEIGADTNAWGGHLNTNFDNIDSNMLSLSISATQTMAGPLKLPVNGLDVGSGQLNVTGGNVSMSGNASAVNGTFSGTLNVTGAATFSTISITSLTGASATFSGTISASTSPTIGGHLTNKTYVDAQDATKLGLSGGTLTGALTLSGDPSLPLQPVTKQFFDARSILTGTGLTGGGNLSANRTISISPGGVSATELASSAVTTAKIANGNVDASKLSGVQAGAAPVFGARAWGLVSLTSSAATLIAGGNITSVSRISGGYVTVTLTTAMTSVNYAVVANGSEDNNVTIRVTGRSTTQFTIVIVNNSWTPQDANFSFMVVG